MDRIGQVCIVSRLGDLDDLICSLCEYTTYDERHSARVKMSDL